jgi:hypothetical protein
MVMMLMVMMVPVTMAVPVMMTVVLIMDLRHSSDQGAVEISRNYLVWVGLGSDNSFNAVPLESLDKAFAHALGDEHLYFVEAWRLMRRSVVKRLCNGEFQQPFIGHSGIVGLINPKFSALASVGGDFSLILTGDRNFHDE